MAVVDSATRVRMVSKHCAWSIRQSSRPFTNGNLNSPTIMLAERAADIIKGKGMLEPSDASRRSRPGLGNPAALHHHLTLFPMTSHPGSLALNYPE